MIPFNVAFISKHLRKILLAGAPLLVALCAFSWVLSIHSSSETAVSDATLLERFRHVEVASVSDALEKVSGKKMYMSHKMRPIFTSRFAGFALTVLLKKEENQDPDALKGMLAAIDQGEIGRAHV